MRDSTGNECGVLAGDTVSGSYVGVNEIDVTDGFDACHRRQRGRPGTQTPVFLAGGAQQFEAVIRYTVNGHFWIEGAGLLSSRPWPSEHWWLDGNGTVVAELRQLP